MEKKRLPAVLILFSAFLCFLFVPKTVSAADENMENAVIENDETGIPDPYFYQYILHSLHKNEDEKFTQAEAAAIDWIQLTTNEYPIKDFKGIGYFTNLKQLDLEYPGLESLERMEELPQLLSLSLYFSGSIKTIDSLALQNFKNLQALNVSGNQLTTLNGIEVLTNLKRLYADCNHITDINALKKLKHLEYVDLSYNKLSDIKPLSNCVTLKKLYLDHTGLKSLKDLKKLKNLQELSFSENEIKNADVLLNFKNLQRLNGSYNKLKKLPDLKKLKKLQYIFIDLWCNLLPEQEIRKKVPAKGLKDSAWLSDLVTFQSIAPKLNSPASYKKITRNTKKITGRLPIARANHKKIYIDFSPSERRLTNKTVVKSDGTFILDHLNLKKYKKGQEMRFSIYIYSAEEKDYVWLDMFEFRLK